MEQFLKIGLFDNFGMNLINVENFKASLLLNHLLYKMKWKNSFVFQLSCKISVLQKV